MGRLTVKTITGKCLVIDVDSFDATTVRDLKELVQDREGLPPDSQRMIFALPKPPLAKRTSVRQLFDDGATLASYGVGEGATIHLVLQLRRPSAFVPPPPTSPVPWASSDEWERFMQGPWAELVSLFDDEGNESAGIRLLRAPTETDSSLLAVVEGPAGSCYQGGKFVVHVRAHGPLQIRVLTPMCHPAVNTTGEVALIDVDRGQFLTHHHPSLLSADRDVGPALRTLRAQLLLTSMTPAQTLLLKERGARQMIRMWETEPRQTERLARVLTALCAMTDLERRTSRAWLDSFVSHCPQVHAEAKALLLVAARHPITGEPRHPEAGLIATDMPAELIHLVVHHLALAHVPAERARLLALYDFSVPSEHQQYYYVNDLVTLD